MGGISAGDVRRWAPIAVALAFLWAAWRDVESCGQVQANAVFLEQALVLVAVVAGAVVDARCRIIPNAVPVAVVVVHALFLFLQAIAGTENVAALAWQSMAGAVVLGGGLLAFTLAYEALAAPGALGGGDLKLVAALGFAFGWERGLAILLAACVAFALQVAVAAVVARLRGLPPDHTGPFCPAIAAGVFLVPLVFP